MREAVIVEGVRTAVGRGKKGTTAHARSEDMMVTVIQELLRRTEGKLDPEEIDDLIVGCAMPEGSQGLNFARGIGLDAGLPIHVPAQTVNRFCSSGLQTIAMAAERIIANGADAIIAGGAESMSLVPMTGFRLAPNPGMARNAVEVYMNMGLTAEHVAEEFNVSRENQDEFAYNSHMRAAKATDDGLFKRDTTVEGLSKLRPVFREGGTVTPGNASPLSDGAAGVVIMEREKAESLGLTPRLRFISFGVAGVPPEIMGIGPVEAVPRALKRAGMELSDIDLIELNEAFAAQAVAVIRTLGMDPDIVNVNGGAVALGHPLGCTGAKLTVQLLHEMERRDSKYGMVTMCIGGGQGAAGIFERLN
jgi:acetyl-CoA acyltransferase